VRFIDRSNATRQAARVQCANASVNTNAASPIRYRSWGNRRGVWIGSSLCSLLPCAAGHREGVFRLCGKIYAISCATSESCGTDENNNRERYVQARHRFGLLSWTNFLQCGPAITVRVLLFLRPLPLHQIAFQGKRWRRANRQRLGAQIRRIRDGVVVTSQPAG
jgi:hypothetical protein